MGEVTNDLSWNLSWMTTARLMQKQALERLQKKKVAEGESKPLDDQVPKKKFKNRKGKESRGKRKREKRRQEKEKAAAEGRELQKPNKSVSSDGKGKGKG